MYLHNDFYSQCISLTRLRNVDTVTANLWFVCVCNGCWWWLAALISLQSCKCGHCITVVPPVCASSYVSVSRCVCVRPLSLQWLHFQRHKYAFILPSSSLDCDQRMNKRISGDVVADEMQSFPYELWFCSIRALKQQCFPLQQMRKHNGCLCLWRCTNGNAAVWSNTQHVVCAHLILYHLSCCLILC